MTDSARRLALESLLADEDSSTADLVVSQILENREQNESLIHELLESKNVNARIRAEWIWQHWFSQATHHQNPKELEKPGKIYCLKNWEDLEKLCWKLAEVDAPVMEVDRAIKRLDQFAMRVKALCSESKIKDKQKVNSLRQVLAYEEKLYGNGENYYAPHNSFLNKVLKTRQGIPLSLSLIYIFVGQRLDWNLKGINTPGHYLVAINKIVIDPFFGGDIVDRKEMAVKFNLSEDTCKSLKGLVATPFQTAERMLANLLNSYSLLGDGKRFQLFGNYLRCLQESNS